MNPTPGRISHASLEQAAQWYVLLHEQGCAAQVREQWLQWLGQGSEHQAAWRYVERVGERFTPLQEEGERAGVLLRDSERGRFSRRQGLKALLVAGAGSLLGLGAWRTASLNGWTADLATGTGENRETLLADGSQLWLGARTAVDTRFGPWQRSLNLRYGEVLLQATGDDARPLSLSTECGRLRVQPGPVRLAVRQMEDSTRLNVYRGTVQVCTGQSGAQRWVAAGQRVDFTAREIGALQPAQSAGESWIRNLLTAEDLPLGQLLDELGRYRHGHLGCDPAVAALSVMGTFPLTETDQALRLLEAALPVRVKRLTDWWVTVGAV